MTNCSNVKRGLNALPVKERGGGVVVGSAAWDPGSGGAVGATSRTFAPAPRTAAAQALISLEKCPSTQGRMASGASSTSVPPSSDLAASGSSQMCQVESLTAA